MEERNWLEGTERNWKPMTDETIAEMYFYKRYYYVKKHDGKYYRYYIDDKPKFNPNLVMATLVLVNEISQDDYVDIATKAQKVRG